MGLYTEYLEKQLDPESLHAERKKQIRRISTLRGNRDVLVYAGDISKAAAGVPVHLDYSDLLPISDQLANLSGTAIDVIIETPGGDGSVAEDVVKLLRQKYDDIGFIVPGWAKSAGTIMAMAADEILMSPASALGPIDAQIMWQGKMFSAEALLEGMERIKDEVVATGALNKAYVPMLQNLSPGEIQDARNKLDFATRLVSDWLARYKFKNWKTRSSTGLAVTPEDRVARANEIAAKLRSHQSWLTHARSIGINELRDMKLVVTDITEQPELHDAVHRLHTLLRMLFDGNVYKVIETASAQIYRMVQVQMVGQVLAPGAPGAPMPVIEGPATAGKIRCNTCGTVVEYQANFVPGVPLAPGKRQFPADNKHRCPTCGTVTNIASVRAELEQRFRKKVTP